MSEFLANRIPRALTGGMGAPGAWMGAEASCPPHLRCQGPPVTVGDESSRRAKPGSRGPAVRPAGKACSACWGWGLCSRPGLGGGQGWHCSYSCFSLRWRG